ncbi:hypothetical protein SAMN04487893_10639 [Myroides guanonis]|uniref:Uncharacterized protein n=1 Tax=Myroides guanonis TaxID=1150112 RepID=A0A1I3QML6_9FLAO|nr:hypothetical protein SAMN04487893_10639 [Myroides guanonis]
MKKLQFKVCINAPASKVYDFMLGIPVNQHMINGRLCLVLDPPMKELGIRKGKFYLLV